MRDADIRPRLHRTLARKYARDPSTVIVDEFGIYNGAHRMDVAVVNGVLSGYEIKGPQDDLRRLPQQARAYGDVFDHVTLVADVKHLDAARHLLPEWWGLTVILRAPRSIQFELQRPSQPNPHVDALAVARLLWREEALEVLRRNGMARGLSGKPRDTLWRALAEGLAVSDLQREVRSAIRSRQARLPHPTLTLADVRPQ